MNQSSEILSQVKAPIVRYSLFHPQTEQDIQDKFVDIENQLNKIHRVNEYINVTSDINMLKIDVKDIQSDIEDIRRRLLYRFDNIMFLILIIILFVRVYS